MGTMMGSMGLWDYTALSLFWTVTCFVAWYLPIKEIKMASIELKYGIVMEERECVGEFNLHSIQKYQEKEGSC